MLADATSSLTVEQVNALGTGSFTVTLTVTDSFGATGVAFTTLTITDTYHNVLALSLPNIVLVTGLLGGLLMLRRRKEGRKNR